MVFLWHHVKEEIQIELELQNLKKLEMIIRRIGHVYQQLPFIKKVWVRHLREGLG